MRWIVIFLLVATTPACTFYEDRVNPVVPVEGMIVSANVIVHRVDGTSVTFDYGIRIKDDTVEGEGVLIDAESGDRIPIRSIPMDQVVAMESVHSSIRRTESALATGAVTIVGAVAVLGLLKVMFGSCPTTYAMVDGEWVLQAESFSYSVVPFLESRDVDRLNVDVSDGKVVLDIRNEALETHYIDQVELLEVRHDLHETVIPDSEGNPLILSAPVAVTRAIDVLGNDISAMVRRADGDIWETSRTRIDSLRADDMMDSIELEFAPPAAAGDRALVLRLRNSLLSTVLLYEVMLKGLGYTALDWMGRDRPNREMVRSSRWYEKNMGLRVSVWKDGEFRQIAHIQDQGPIAWKDVVIPLPRDAASSPRVRLDFVSDNWHFDWIASAATRDAKPQVIQASHANDTIVTNKIDRLQEADDNYLITRPGDRFELVFDVGEAGVGERTFLMAAEGYYVEWMRRDWLGPRTVSAPINSDETLWQAMELWLERRDSFRQQFEDTKIARSPAPAAAVN